MIGHFGDALPLLMDLLKRVCPILAGVLLLLSGKVRLLVLLLRVLLPGLVLDDDDYARVSCIRIL